MDFATIIGLITAIGAISGAYVLEGGHLSSIFLTGPLMIVVGGTIGATMVTSSISTTIKVPTFLRLAFWGVTQSTQETIDFMVKLAEKARREGILGLENDLNRTEEKFLKKIIQLVIEVTLNSSYLIQFRPVCSPAPKPVIAYVRELSKTTKAP